MKEEERAQQLAEAEAAVRTSIYWAEKRVEVAAKLLAGAVGERTYISYHPSALNVADTLLNESGLAKAVAERIVREKDQSSDMLSALARVFGPVTTREKES